MSQASKVASSVLGPVLLGLLVSSLAAGYMGCKKDEPPPPLPSAAPAAVPTPTAPLELAPEELPVASASASVKKPTGGAPAQSFAKCCAALTQNAASAPEPTKTSLTQAAGMCNSLVAAGKSGPGVVSAIQGLLRGVGMPSACL
ncbi:MAG TPA: acyltransferase [Polyangiaceae bacterium]|nr:acyltransferase [Polyangiaceae bacterium]